MFPLLKPKLEKLVGKEIILTNLKNWTNKGTIWTDDLCSDFGFIYRIFDRCIGYIGLEDGDIRFLKGNIYYYPTGHKGILFIHGGRNPLSTSGKPNPEYKRLSDFLDDSVFKNKF